MGKKFEKDYELVQRVIEGDKKSWDALFFGKLKPYIEGMCAKAFLPEHREHFRESVMEAIYLIYSNLSKYRGEAKITSWCYFYILEAIRKEREKLKQSDKKVDIEHIVDNKNFATYEEEKIYKKFMVKKIEQSLSKLNKNYRKAIELHIIDGYTVSQIAEMEDVSVNTVKSWLKRGKKALKKILEGENGF